MSVLYVDHMMINPILGSTWKLQLYILSLEQLN